MPSNFNVVTSFVQIRGVNALVELADLLNAGLTQGAIAKHFGVSDATVSRLVRGAFDTAYLMKADLHEAIATFRQAENENYDLLCKYEKTVREHRKQAIPKAFAPPRVSGASREHGRSMGDRRPLGHKTVSCRDTEEGGRDGTSPALL